MLPKTRKQAWEWYADIKADCTTGSRRYTWQEAERTLGRSDLFYLMVRLLRRPDVNKDWLFERCREVQAEPDFCLDLWAREHYKSTIITFGLTIQDLLNDPEITFGIFSHTKSIARGFLNQIKREFEDNEWLKSLYFDVLWENPKKESPRWSEDGGIIIKRKGNPKESSVEGHGLVDGQPTSKHFKVLLFDDVVTLESVSTVDQVEKTTNALNLAYNLGTAKERGGKMRFIGTRYSLFDTYADLIRRGSAKVRTYAATHNGRMDGKPVFLSDDGWRDKLKNWTRQNIAAQLLQNPLADEDATFRTEWLKSYEVRPRTLNVYILADPSRGRSATSDNTSMAVIGIAASGAKFLLDGYCHRMTLSQRWVKLRELHKKWSRAKGVQHIGVGYERYGAQSDDEYFQEQMEREKYFFTIDELNWPRDGTNSKRERVERLEPDFRNGRFFLPLPVWHDSRARHWSVDVNHESKSFGELQYRDVAGLTKPQMQAIEAGSPDLVARALKAVDEDGQLYDATLRLIEEYKSFPFALRDDFLDACSRVYDVDPITPAHAARNIEEPTYWDA